MKKAQKTPETPLERAPALAEAVGVPDLYLKREDLHEYGSHKGRSIPAMIDFYIAAGDRRFALSSSGNAGLAAALYVAELDARPERADDPISLDVYVGGRAAPNKLEKLRRAAETARTGVGSADAIRVLVKERPLQALAQAAAEGARSLRQSTDDAALAGYASLARELDDALPKGGAIFVAASSGTTAQALAAHMAERADVKKRPIQIHIVQTSGCHPLADAFDSYDGPDESSIADAIVDKIAQRKAALTPLIRATGGRGWVATNDEIRAAQELASARAGIELSPNGALAIAGAMKAAEIGWDAGGPVICVVGGA